jgi:hypothetical protein
MPSGIYSPKARVARKMGQVLLRLRPEEAAELRAWAEEHGGLAALVRQLLARRRRAKRRPGGRP